MLDVCCELFQRRAMSEFSDFDLSTFLTNDTTDATSACKVDKVVRPSTDNSLLSHALD